MTIFQTIGRTFFAAAIFAAAGVGIHGQQLNGENTGKYPLRQDVATIDGLMKASYEVVSGGAGEKRNWERDNSLHHKNALYHFFRNVDGQRRLVSMTLAEFHGLTDAMVATTPFYETEVNREVRVFGKMAHVWSTYETRLVKDGPAARRGINSVQLLNENDRWYVVSWTFEFETPANPIPRTFDSQR